MLYLGGISLKMEIESRQDNWNSGKCLRRKNIHNCKSSWISRTFRIIIGMNCAPSLSSCSFLGSNAYFLFGSIFDLCTMTWRGYEMSIKVRAVWQWSMDINGFYLLMSFWRWNRPYLSRPRISRSLSFCSRNRLCLGLDVCPTRPGALSQKSLAYTVSRPGPLSYILWILSIYQINLRSGRVKTDLIRPLREPRGKTAFDSALHEWAHVLFSCKLNYSMET